MEKIVIITGSGGLIGSEAVRQFSKVVGRVIGIDNNMRSYFFGPEASTDWQVNQLKQHIENYIHFNIDIRDRNAIDNLFKNYSTQISLIIHTAAQPSHDWAAREPITDFEINATGTLHLLEATRKFCPEATFIFCSTNKVYGDRPNSLPLIELGTRWEVPEDHPYYHGIDEEMSLDTTKHSIFGASKVSADIMVQEYGRYFHMKTACFRGGCLTGPSHSGAMLHGFLSYLMKCTVTGQLYNIFGYKGKQVRDNIHSRDLVNAFRCFYDRPKVAAVYNIGGGRESNCSMLEGIALCEDIAGKRLKWTYINENRNGDHIWWVSNLGAFKRDYPEWKITYNVKAILQEIYAYNKERWKG